LGYRLSRRGKVLFIPSAKAFHHSAGENRIEPGLQQYHVIRSKFAIQVCAMGRSRAAAFAHSAAWATFQTVSEILAATRGRMAGVSKRIYGRTRGLASCLFWSLPVRKQRREANA
jgi:hypothetical protein